MDGHFDLTNRPKNVKKLFLIFFFIPIFCIGQEYVDLFRMNYGETIKNEFKEVGGSTSIKAFEAKVTLPIPVNSDHALITGADFVYNNLQFFPWAQHTDLFSTTLKLGLASNWTDKWSTTLVVLPKVASDYKHISEDDFYLGGLALVKFKKKENLLYRFGFYGSQEAFGFFTTPILGIYYLSPNNKFEMDMSLPITADVNYKLGIATIGMDYSGISRSFKVHYHNSPTLYADVSSVEFAGYLQFNIVKNRILLRSKLGYSNNDFEVYRENDQIDLGISAFNIGDDRDQLNPSLAGSVFFRFEMLYRFHLSKPSPSENQ